MGDIAVLLLAGLSLVLAFLLALSWRHARRISRRLQALDEIARVSDASDSLAEALAGVSEVIVPHLADFCMIDVIAEGQVRRATVRVADGGPAGVERGLAERTPSLPEGMVRDESGAARRPRFFERVSDEDLSALAHDPDDLDFLRGIGVRSVLTVVLRARGRVTGALTFGVAWSRRRYRRSDARFATTLSGRIALALDNAGLFSDLERAERARAEIAETLQRGLLPPPLPHIPGWSMAAMYRPAGAENEVGGDFYDAFPVAGGWMLIIGDVTGRGARAASITAQARYTLRTAAALTGDPLVALATLNRALLARRDSSLCSVAAFSLSADPSHAVRVAVAGHPPPLLVDGETVSEQAPAGPVLGALADATWSLGRVRMTTGQQLVVVTDGITEASSPEGRFGEERLRAELAGVSSPVRAVRRLEAALHAFTNGRFEDDAAILAIAPTATGPSEGSAIAIASQQPALAASGFGGDG
ncbi:MAG TPA: GAF domain-containing SpoIIE family protein phosphatase [Solirubrobacterales bacterium]|nr:GAF domain-containing SpoIIE family protein phosphatase [Solirubrobacterales bacterium]